MLKNSQKLAYGGNLDVNLMFQNITNCFDRQGWKYTVIEGQTIVVLGITGKNAKLRCIAQLEADKFQFVFLSSYEQKVPEDKRLLVAELLTRLNFNIFLGNLELDWLDGELRFKTSMNYESVELTEKVIENLVVTNIMTMDSCLTGIIKVIDGTLTPESAVQEELARQRGKWTTRIIDHAKTEGEFFKVSETILSDGPPA